MHAFAEARAVGRVLLAALVVTAVALVALSVRRRGPRPAPIQPATRAGAVRVNNALLLAVIVVVGFGLLFPVLSGDDLVVTGRYFAIVTAPLALGVLAAIGVGPRLGWQPRPWREVRTRLRPAAWGAAAALAVAAPHPRRPPPALPGHDRPGRRRRRPHHRRVAVPSGLPRAAGALSANAPPADRQQRRPVGPGSSPISA